jgi:hypothetical protein
VNRTIVGLINILTGKYLQSRNFKPEDKAFIDTLATFPALIGKNIEKYRFPGSFIGIDECGTFGKQIPHRYRTMEKL